QAVGSALHSGRAELGLGLGGPAVDVLPGAHLEALRLQGGDVGAAELRPHIGPIGTLYVDRADTVAARPRTDRRRAAAAGARRDPDPHARAVEGRGSAAPRRGVGGGGEQTEQQAGRERQQRRCPTPTPPHTVLRSTILVPAPTR